VHEIRVVGYSLCCSFWDDALSFLAVKDILKIDMGGKWYVRILKVCIAIIGAILLVAVLFFLYGFIRGVVFTSH
jgi:hypothetical protein